MQLNFGLVKVAQRSGKPQLVGNRYLLCSAADSPTTLLGIMKSWRASDDRVSTFVMVSLQTPIKVESSGDIDNILQFSPTSEKDSEKDVDVLSRTLNSFLCEWFPNVANFSHGVNLGLLPWPDSRAYSARNWVRRK